MSGQRIKIIEFITELSTGGAQVALTRLLAGLDRRRFELIICCLYNGDGAPARQIKSMGIRVIDLGMQEDKRRLDAFGRLYRLLRLEMPDILHTWLFHANIPGRVIGRLAGVPTILSSERTMEMEGLSRRWLNRVTAPFANQILCVSQRVADYAVQEIGIPSNKILIIPNGIDLAPYQNLPEQSEARQRFGLPVASQLVGTVSRARPVKNLELLLEAFAILTSSKESQPDGMHLAIVGDGPLLPNLLAQTRRLGISNQVFFLGEQEDIPTFLAGLDVFVLSSQFEGLPNAVLEAMAAGLPVAATAVGGVPELVVPGETGLLVPSNEPQALALALSHLLADEPQRKRLGQAGQERVAHYFSIKNTVGQTAQLYEIWAGKTL